jgi:UDP-N-acetylmuramate dehydrogenase
VHILENIPLAPLTTLGVGGAARYFAEVSTPREVREALDFAHSCELPLFVLGGGSNLVVADAGFRGLILKLDIRGVTERREGGKVLLTAGAGENWDALVERAVTCGLAGIECLSGIPGSVGGTPIQNVGAYGQEVSDTIREVAAVDVVTGEMHRLTNDDCEFTYRGSRFNTRERGRWIVVQVTFALKPGGTPAIHYPDLQSLLGPKPPTLPQVRKAICEIRRAKGMLMIEGDENCRSAGSFFKNPVLSSSAYRELQERASARGLSIPSHPALASQHKVPAAWLVEQAGFPKGYRRGRVAVSSKHALALINLGGATAAEVIALKDEIQRGVQEQFGIELHPEPVFVGF